MLFGGILLISCESNNEQDIIDNSFRIQSSYNSIKSYPGGGGLFIFELIDTPNHTDDINLEIHCEKELNAYLCSQDGLSNHNVFEVLIEPEIDIPISNYRISIVATRGNYREILLLDVEIIDWTSMSELSDLADIKMNNYINWLNNKYPNIEIVNETRWSVYSTYPGILIVEHFTLLNDKYEIRLCNHAMIPPNDWSVIRLRERNSRAPFLAAKQDSTNGEIYTILVEDYPLLYGY
ncbi:MAG: hypothetical protein C0597_07110 [Marinilabiliales bacterium]|nr:MAG: hypothetical protein C0597_07110 [Marinilabiliales bacterium]